MNESQEDKPDTSVPLCQWEFDNWSSQHWEEIRAGEVKETRSWVQLSDTDHGQKVTIHANQKEAGSIVADRDQWGTWITFQIGNEGFTIAQEDGTMSFIDAMIAALTKLKGITDIETTPPVLKELKSDEAASKV